MSLKELADQKNNNITEDLEKLVKRTNGWIESNQCERTKTNQCFIGPNLRMCSHDFTGAIGRKILTFCMRLQDNHKDEWARWVKSLSQIKIEGAPGRMTIPYQSLNLITRAASKHRKAFSKTDLNVTSKNNIIDFELLIEEKESQNRSWLTCPTLEALPFSD